MNNEQETMEYMCIAPEEGEKLCDYYNDVLAESDALRFEEHVALCFRCQEELLKLDWVMKTLGDHATEFFRLPVEPRQPEDVSVWEPEEKPPLPVATPWWQTRLPYALAASFLVVSLGLGLWLLSLRRQLADQNQAVATANQAFQEAQRQLQEITNRSGQSQTQMAELRQGYETQIAELRQTVNELSQPQLNVPIEDLDPRRVASRDGQQDSTRTIDVPAGARFFTLILNLAGESSHSRYEVEIKDQRGTLIWQAPGLQKTEFNTFTLALSRPLFPAGQYRIRLFGLRGGHRELVEEYTVRIRYH